MSDFSDFFPAAAGGGIGQTITVGDVSYPNAQSLANFTGNKLTVFGASGASGTATSNLNIQLSSLTQPVGGTQYVKRLATADTYVTVADITSATNGGACYAILGWNGDNTTGNFNKNFTTRITLDGGSAVEYPFAPVPDTASRKGFVAMGKAWVLGSSINGSVNGGLIQSQNQIAAESGPKTLYNNYDATTGGWTNENTWTANIQRLQFDMIDAISASTQGLPYLHFTTSLKVEMKILAAGTVSNVYCGSSILIF
mgnify:CR=1 FL=1